MRKYTLKHIILTGFILLSSGMYLMGQNQGWNIPEGGEEKKSPFPFTKETNEAGENLYNTNCKSCHGDPGKGNSMNLQPPPGDPAEESFQASTDGEMYYKITNGKTPMPSFKNALTPEERWQIVGYMRSFNPDYQQVVAEIEEKADQEKVEKDRITFTLNYSQENNQLEATIEDIVEGERKPIRNAELALYAKRYFGNYQLGDPQSTNDSGKAIFGNINQIPQDTNDSIAFVVQLTNEELYEGAKEEIVLQAGKDIERISLRAQRAWWNTVWKAPVWLIITYLSAVILVWGIIIHILLKLRAIKKIGDQKEKGFKETGNPS